MITAFRLKNFKCYEELNLENCKRINVITRDNGNGKKVLPELIYLASGYNIELVLTLRAWRDLCRKKRSPCHAPSMLASARSAL